MPFLPDELPVSLEHLDDYLKAILKIKIREFVHLNPIFNCIPSIDVSSYARAAEAEPVLQNLTAVVRPKLSQTRTQFKQTAINAVKNASLRAEVEAISASRPKFYFAGHDVECPNRVRKFTMRKRPARRIVV